MAVKNYNAANPVAFLEAYSGLLPVAEHNQSLRNKGLTFLERNNGLNARAIIHSDTYSATIILRPQGGPTATIAGEDSRDIEGARFQLSDIFGPLEEIKHG
jgi:hypothetical protein